MTEPEITLPDVTTYRSLQKRMKRLELPFVFGHPIDVVVRYLGQVDMLNYRSGNPRPEYSFRPVQSGGTITRGKAVKAGLTMIYDELPYEWVTPDWGYAQMVVRKGPLDYFSIMYKLSAQGERTKSVFYVDYVPTGLGLLSWLLAKNIVRVLHKALVCIDTRAATDDTMGLAPYSESATDNGVDQARLTAEWTTLSGNAKLAAAMAEFVATAPEKHVGRIRPLALAAQYGFSENDIIRFYLKATRAGFFNLSWDILCPACRGDKRKINRLGALTTKAHCENCNIEYGADFDKNVELTFRPVDVVRNVNYGSYCIHGLSNTPHVFSQINVWPDEPCEFEYHFPENNYYIECVQLDGRRPIRIDETPGATGAIVDLNGNLNGDALVLKRDARLTFRNSEGAGERDEMFTVRLVADGYRDFALSAARVTAMQEFRNQFGSEALAPDVQIGIENLAILFTDLKDSTPLYETMGDTPAFALVRQHFDVLTDVIGEHDGAVVKTIGDAVMAAFVDPARAFAAGLEILRRMRATRHDVTVKIGMHTGPCIAVTLNDRLDYFGTTVNRAARIQGQAAGHDVVVAREITDRYRLAGPEDFARSEFTGTLKGITAQADLVRFALKV